MISFIQSGSEKRVYRFPSGNKLPDARKEIACYIGSNLHSNSLIKS